MTIDERLAAITMNLELAIRSQEDARSLAEKRHHEVSSEISALGQAVESLRERTDVLLTSTSQLLEVARIHDDRIRKLERAS